MKKLINIVFAALALFVMSSCDKNEDITYKDTQVEIDAATYIAKTSGYPFTLFTRVPLEPGRAVYNSANSYGGIDPLLSRTYTDTIRMRINLVGKQQSSALTFPIRVATEFTTAVEGVHFVLVDRTVTIPANSSFGFVRWVVKNPGVTNNLPVTVAFQLQGNGTVKVNENYQYIGWSITQ